MASLVVLRERSNMRVSASIARTRLMPERTDRRPAENALVPLATDPGEWCRRRDPADLELDLDTTDRLPEVPAVLVRLRPVCFFPPPFFFLLPLPVLVPVPARRRCRAEEWVSRVPSVDMSAVLNPGVMACSPRIIRARSRALLAVPGGENPPALPRERDRRMRASCRAASCSLTTSRMLSARASCCATSGVKMPDRATVLWPGSHTHTQARE